MLGLLRFYWSVLVRATRDTRDFASRQGLVPGVTITILGGLIGGVRSADIGQWLNFGIAAQSAVIAALLVLTAYFLWSLVHAPHLLAQDERARLAAIEAERDRLRARAETAECRARIKARLGELYAHGEVIPPSDKAA